MKYLSVIIPSYNSAAVLKNNVPYLINYLKEKKYDYEILVVDDGSNDNGATKQVAEELGCTYLQNEKNAGKGESVRKGMLAATGKFRIFTDADIPFYAEAIEQFLFYLDEKEFHLAIGDRTLNESTYFNSKSGLRNIASKSFSFFVGRFVAGGMFDTQCGIKGFRAEVAKDIFGVSRIKGFTFDVELLYIALKRNYDIKRLPVTLRSQEGQSVKLLLHSFEMMADLMKIKFNHLGKKYNRKK
ncbi:MAG: glycosyltransferase [Bacteroidia bacterium]